MIPGKASAGIPIPASSKISSSAKQTLILNAKSTSELKESRHNSNYNSRLGSSYRTSPKKNNFKNAIGRGLVPDSQEQSSSKKHLRGFSESSIRRHNKPINHRNEIIDSATGHSSRRNDHNSASRENIATSIMQQKMSNTRAAKRNSQHHSEHKEATPETGRPPHGAMALR